MVNLSIVYDRFLSTAGGGERSALEYALALARNSKDVYLIHDSGEEIDLSRLAAQFSIKLPGNVKLVQKKDENELIKFLKEQNVDIFCNHTHCSTLPNYAKIGMYALMFPDREIFMHPNCVQDMSTYDYFFCISEFTRIYTERYWAECVKGKNVEILIPPISETHLNAQNRFEDKEKLILNVGRFCVAGHNKCQLEVIKSFRQLVDDGVLDDSWRLEVCGQFNDVADTAIYLKTCTNTASGYNIGVQTNVPFGELCEKYKRSAMLWQFTGYGTPFGIRPEKCEHLGLVALDALAYGSIPVIYSRSGASFVIDSGIDGFTFTDYAELKQVVSFLTSCFSTPTHQEFFEKAKAKAKTVSSNGFQEKLWEILGEKINE